MESSRTDAGGRAAIRSIRRRQTFQACAERMDELVGLISWLQIDQARKGAFKQEKPLARLADRWFALCEAFEAQTAPFLTSGIEEDSEPRSGPPFLQQIERTETILRDLTAERAVVTKQHLEDLDNLLDAMEKALGVAESTSREPLTGF